MVRVNNQLGFFPVMFPKGKPLLAVFGMWLLLARGWNTREAANTQQKALQMERKREHRERKRKVKTRGKMFDVSQC